MTEDDPKPTEKIEKKAEKKKAPEDSIERAEAAAGRLEAGNKELAKLLERQEGLAVENTLGGEADAGAQKKTDEEKKAETAKAYLEGTGLSEEAFPENSKKKH